MSIITKVSPGTKAGSPNPADFPATYIDILYSHADYLRANNGRIARGSLAGRDIAVVGSGAAGLISAYQLMALGANVTILEASDRAGGRLHTISPLGPGNPAKFEMGAMRIPPSEQLFNYYAKQFGVQPGGQFPDPGQVDTRIIYRNQAFDWPAKQKPPAIFDNVSTGWDALAQTWQPISQDLVNPTPESLASAQAAWQSLIYDTSIAGGPEKGYSTISFYQALVESFVENFASYGLQQPWTGDDFELFAALGVGGGGFGSLYTVNFAEIARLVINGLETQQQFYPGGMVSLVNGFLDSTPDPSRPDLTLGSCVLYNQRVVTVERQECASKPVLLVTASGQKVWADAAILATTTRSMQVDMNITDQVAQFLPQPVSSAIRQLHLMNSSKLFVATKSKFWQDASKKLPANIQADVLVRGLYCLDYTPGQTDGNGVVLISYTWGDDSTKYLALKDPHVRLEACLRALENRAGDFVAALRQELIPETAMLMDWQDEHGFFGAFKLNQPGQDQYNQQLYAHFLGANGIYLAGDSVGWCGGWIESALQTGMNAACAVAQLYLGPTGLYPASPMTQSAALYGYGPSLDQLRERAATAKAG